MQQYSATFRRLLSSALATSPHLEKQVGEDTIDWLHRLAKKGLTPHEISELTEVPYVSVEYWYDVNGYRD